MNQPTSKQIKHLEMWGGIDATVNRVADRYIDQLEKSGHAHRIDDINRIASLGITTLRYPILWERIAPQGLKKADWKWADERLSRLREVSIHPIVGLVHHGSGPLYTDLIDPDFPQKLANYARAVAERYPWITQYTPINEPLTTARFSCLYGLWYPHKKNDTRAFAQAFIHECKAIVLAMEEIRKINPNAILVQTEDMGKVYSTPDLKDQCEFDNERRFLTFDILSGRVTKEHPMWNYLRDNGISEKDLVFFREHSIVPGIVGVNYYVTSERFLDTRVDRYPSGAICTNNDCTYADVEAVRVATHDLAGPYTILKEVWQRYLLPLAVTEAHMGCTREEQLRWILEFWDAGTRLLKEGIDIRAITAWALFGIYDWDSLVTLDRGHYEPGAFDVRGKTPRPTALSVMIHDLSKKGSYSHDIVESPGWWRRDDRHTYEPTAHYEKPSTQFSLSKKSSHPKPLVIVGATGTLGRAFAHSCDIRDLRYILLSRKDLDITNKTQVYTVFNALKPWGVVNAAGYVRVDEAENDCDTCMSVNTQGPASMAHVCKTLGVPFMTFSSDMVFDGTKKTPYLERDIPHPINVYGKSKAEAERLVSSINPQALIIRTSAFFGPWDQYNFATTTLKSVISGATVYASDDQIVSPTYIPELTNTALDLLIDNASGIWHVANNGEVSWSEFAQLIVKSYGIKTFTLRDIPNKQKNECAPRPQYTVLGSERGGLLSPLEEAIAQYIQEMKKQHIDQIYGVFP